MKEKIMAVINGFLRSQNHCVSVLAAKLPTQSRFVLVPQFPSLVTDRAEMGIPNHDTIRTDNKVVTEIVNFVIHLSSIRELKITRWRAVHPSRFTLRKPSAAF